MSKITHKSETLLCDKWILHLGFVPNNLIILFQLKIHLNFVIFFKSLPTFPWVLFFFFSYFLRLIVVGNSVIFILLQQLLEIQNTKWSPNYLEAYYYYSLNLHKRSHYRHECLEGDFHSFRIFRSPLPTLNEKSYKFPIVNAKFDLKKQFRNLWTLPRKFPYHES